MHRAPIDRMAHQDSPVHRLDPRGKLLVTLLFTGVVLSLPGLSVSPVVCFVTGPYGLLLLAGVPLKRVAMRILLASPFVLVLALACPYYERHALRIVFGPFAWDTTTGWVRCTAICAKYAVSMSALLCLVSTTRFADLLASVRRLGMPQALVTQLGFLYRQLFVLLDQAQRVTRARQTRRLRFLGLREELSLAGAMLGSLLMRSLDRSRRIGLAMHARGFSGRWYALPGTGLGTRDGWFIGLSLLFIGGLRFLLGVTML